MCKYNSYMLSLLSHNYRSLKTSSKSVCNYYIEQSFLPLNVMYLHKNLHILMLIRDIGRESEFR